jgi:preprotein translocase subunit SecE
VGFVADTVKKTAGDGAADVPARRTNPVQFFQEVRRESSKVTWPTWKETWLTTVMVFIMVALTMVFFFVVDYLLGIGTQWLLTAGTGS